MIRSLAWTVLALSLPALGDEATARLAALTIENDFFAGYDHHYTNGMQAAFVVSPRTVFAVGQRIYTPTNTDIADPDPRDRPYAGWLYAMVDRRLDTRGTIDHLTFSLGLLGPPSLCRQGPNGGPRINCDARPVGPVPQ